MANGTQDPPSADKDVQLLSSLLSQDLSESSNEELHDLAKLLAGLDNADGVAKGLEGKLDAVLGDLDKLLVSLEQQNGEDEDHEKVAAPIVAEDEIGKGSSS